MSRYFSLFLVLIIVIFQNASSFTHVNFMKANCKPKIFNLKPLSADKTGQPKIRSREWALQRGIEPGFGGIWEGDPNAPQYNITFICKGHEGKDKLTLMVPNDRYLYHYFEEQNMELPIINKVKMCRQGCCTVCAAKIIEGKVKMDAPLGLLKDMRDQGYTLTCCSLPRSDAVFELQEEDFIYIKQWADGFEGGGKQWGGFLPDDD